MQKNEQSESVNQTTSSTKKVARIGSMLLLGILAFSVIASAQTTGMKVQTRSHDNEEVDNQLYAHYKIFNLGTGTVPASVPLSSLTMRYWFTNETPSDPLMFECDYAQINCANIRSKFVVLAKPVSLANTYLELSFTSAAGTLAPGQNTGEIQTRVHHQAYSNFLTNETFSFISDPSFVYKDFTHVTLYLNGVLVWGTEPK